LGDRERVHVLDRWWDYGFLAKAAADSGYGFSFQLSDLPNYNELTALFERFRIDQVECRIVYQQVPNTATFSFPTVLFSTDNVDSAAPATELSVMQRENLVMKSFSSSTSVVTHALTPRLLVAGSGATVVVQAPQNTWVESAYPTETYYGLKMWISNFNSTNSGNASLRVYFRYRVSLKTVL